MASFHGPDRPDPDALLERMRRDESRAARGKLRIYFGACAGVGKTYAMLLAARRFVNEGTDVVIGVVETHGRAETAALLNGSDEKLEVLPCRNVDHKGHRLCEFDLDAALARRPGLIIVDELAHTNVVGSRHPKRWQDVEELLVAGVDVMTALNVQHLDSLSDVVASITGVRVFETIPDRFFDRADEVIVVDISPQEVLKRLAAGQVYVPEQAERAAKNFFRVGNLLALREIALRRIADRVEEDVQIYRVEQDISPVWRTEGSLLCCVGPDPGSEHTVRSASRLAHQLDVPWAAAYVETPRLQRLHSRERERILRTVRLAQDLGAHTVILSGSDVASLLVNYARSGNFSKLVMGRPGKTRFWRPSIARRVARIGVDLDLIEVGRMDPLKSPIEPPRMAAKLFLDASGANPKTPLRIKALFGAVLACVIAALVSTPLLPYLSLANIAMIFLLVVALVALKWGRGPAALAAFLSVAEYDFFFVPPRFSFAVSDLQYLVTFAVMLTVALIIGQLAANLRHEARVAAHREGRARALYEFSRRLSSALQTDEVIGRSIDAIENAFRCEATILVADGNDDLIIPSNLTARPNFEPAIAQWSMQNRQPAGAGTDTLPSGPWLYLPLRTSMRSRGVLAIRPSSRRLLMIPEQLRHLETFASLVAISLERVHYVDIAQKAIVSIESERLRNSLLSALSHDLRTPLTSLMGLADSMFYIKPTLSQPYLETAQAMRDEARRMVALVENLLDMARIQSGEVQLKKVWVPLEEVVGAAIESTKNRLKNHLIKIEIKPPLSFLEMDPVLMERVFVNLLENAAKYTPAGSTIAITARIDAASATIAIEDDGPGLPADFRQEGRQDEIFEKFTRGEKESATAGVGLGLAICRAIVEAHQGTICVDSSALHGARFMITMPRGESPTMGKVEASKTVYG